MTLADDRSPRAYEREADATRRRLSTSLDELASNLTPGRMLDEVLSYARAGGGDFLRGLGNAASANPMPTLLIGIGAAMFLTGKGRVDASSGNGNGHGLSVLRHAADVIRGRNGAARTATARPYGSPGYGDHGRRDAASTAAGIAGGIGSAAARAAGSVGSAASSIAGGVGSAAGAVGSAASTIAGGVGSAAGAVGSAAANAASAVGSAAAGAAGAVRSAASSAVGAVDSAAGAVGSAATSAADTVGSTASRLATGVRSGAATVGSVAAGAAGTIRDTAAAGVSAAGDLAATAGGYVSDAAGTVGEFAASARDTAMEQGQHVYDQGADLAREVKNRTNRLIQEQPLAVAAAGLAIGAAIAAVLPRTRTEDSFLGETSDALKDTFAGAATEQFQRAKEATGRVVEEVTKVAEKEGISATVAADVVRDIGEKVKHVVTAAGAKMTDDGGQATSDASGPPKTKTASGF